MLYDKNQMDHLLYGWFMWDKNMGAKQISFKPYLPGTDREFDTCDRKGTELIQLNKAVYDYKNRITPVGPTVSYKLAIVDFNLIKSIKAIKCYIHQIGSLDSASVFSKQANITQEELQKVLVCLLEAFFIRVTE